MCDPVTGMAAASAGMSFLGQRQQAKQANRTAAVNRQSAVSAYHQENAVSDAQAIQEGIIYRTEASDTILEAARSRGSAIAGQSDSGASGQSYQELIAGYNSARDTVLGRSAYNANSVVAASQDNKLASYNKLKQRYAQNQPVQKPSLFNAILPVVSTGIAQKYKLGGD